MWIRSHEVICLAAVACRSAIQREECKGMTGCSVSTRTWSHEMCAQRVEQICRRKKSWIRCEDEMISCFLSAYHLSGTVPRRALPSEHQPCLGS